MAGLLDFLNSDQARLGIGLMAAGGPTTDPNKTGLGQRLQTAFDTVATQKAADIKNDYMKSLMEQANAEATLKQQKAEQDAAMNQIFMGMMKQATGQTATTPQAAPPPQAGGATPPPQAPPMAPNAPPASADNPQGILAITQAIQRGQQQAAPPQQQPQQQAAAPGPVLAPGQQMPSIGIPGMPGMTPAMISALTMYKPEMGSAMANQYKTFSTPIELKAGYSRDPATGNVIFTPDVDKGMVPDGRGGFGFAPGYVRSQAELAGATKGAEARAGVEPAIAIKAGEKRLESENTLVDTIDAMGNTRPMTRQQILDANKTAPGTVMLKRAPRIEEYNKQWLDKKYQPIVDAGDAAKGTLNNLEAISNIDVRTGLGSDKLTSVASAMTAMGVAPKSVANYASNMQAYNGVVLQELLNTYKSQKGVQTDQDAERIMRGFPNIKNTPQANEFMIDFVRARARQEARKAEAYENGRRIVDTDPKYGGDYGVIDQQWRKSLGSIFDDPDMARWKNQMK